MVHICESRMSIQASWQQRAMQKQLPKMGMASKLKRKGVASGPKMLRAMLRANLAGNQ
jgi:hypothetical protein